MTTFVNPTATAEVDMDHAPLRRRRYVALMVLAVVVGAAACSGGSGGSRPSLSPSRSATRSPALPTPSATVGQPPTRAPVVTSKPQVTTQPPAAAPPATTAPAPVAASSSNDETPWGWIIAALVAVAAIIGISLWLASRRRRP